MAELDTVFGINSITIDGETGSVNIIAGSVDPSAGGGVEAPTNTHYLRDNGEHWYKSGAGDTDWTERMSVAGGVLADGLDGIVDKAVDFTFDGNAVVAKADTTAGAVEATLPLAGSFTNKIFILKWAAGLEKNKVSMKAQIGELIDGFNCHILGEIEDALWVVSDGIEWSII